MTKNNQEFKVPEKEKVKVTQTIHWEDGSTETKEWVEERDVELEKDKPEWERTIYRSLYKQLKFQFNDNSTKLKDYNKQMLLTLACSLKDAIKRDIRNLIKQKQAEVYGKVLEMLPEKGTIEEYELVCDLRRKLLKKLKPK